jgi:tetratricopeptide (TPR) repeat protein
MKKSLRIMALIATFALAPALVFAQKGGGGGGNKGGGQGNQGGRGNQGQGNPGRGNQGQGNQGQGNPGRGNQGGRGQQFQGPSAPRPQAGARAQVGPGNAGAAAQFYRPGDQSIYRNDIRIGTRPYNVAPNNYRPSYRNYSWHNGYWNNSYGWNPQIGYGRSYWGPGYGYGNYGGYGIRIGNVQIGLGGGLGAGGLGNYGGYGYGRYPIGWGYGGWGLGNTLYRSGYASYYNPYWTNNDGGTYVYDYAQPIYVTGSTSVDAAPPNSTNTLVDSAVSAFKSGDYQSALTQIDQAIKANPNDGVLHELRALTLFATEKYSEAAATIHSVLAVGPGWDWPTMASLYPDVEQYTSQLRALESFAKSNTDDAGAQFLLGYHYMTLGHPESAATAFASVVKLQPKDRVAQDLLALVDKPKEGEQPEPLPKPGEDENAKPEEPPPAPFKAEAIAGAWTANRDDGAKFKLDLNADKTFKWHYEQGDRHDEFTGTYSMEGSLLVLTRKDGGAMVGHLTPDGDGKFTFKLLGAPKDDPGLAFNK